MAEIKSILAKIDAILARIWFRRYSAPPCRVPLRGQKSYKSNKRNVIDLKDFGLICEILGPFPPSAPAFLGQKLPEIITIFLKEAQRWFRRICYPPPLFAA